MAKRQLRAARLPEPAVLRQWALDHGFEVGEKGRLSGEVQSAYLDQKNSYLARQPKRLATMRKHGLIA